MNSRILPINSFLTEWKESHGVLFDSRSPSEFTQGHIPGAISLPLLSDEHRHLIGTCYKQKGREAAVLLGFELAGPFFHQLIQQAKTASAQKKVFVYCWRGGMRSNITAWLLATAGLEVSLLEGGYKSFRKLVQIEFEKERNVIVLGGKTGSGKTELLFHLKNELNQVIDLEQLAQHKGSAFGALGLPAQPTQEHFENLLANSLLATDPVETLWLENESRQIGNVNLPTPIYQLIRTSPLIEIQIPEKVRRKRILSEYGNFPPEILAERTVRIGKRLGNNHLKDALSALESGDISTWLDIILVYYDKTYQYGNNLRDPDRKVTVETQLDDLPSLSSSLKKMASELSQNSNA